MSKRVQIFIDDQQIDLPLDFTDLQITYALRDRQGIAANTGSRSEYAFQIPATKNNDAVFNTFWEVGRLNPNASVFKPARILVDGLPYFNGKAQLTSVTTTDAQDYWRGGNYRVAFYSNNADWVQDLRELKLKDLPYTTHVLSEGQVLTGYQNEYDLPVNNDFGYGLIKLREWSFPNKIDVLNDSTPHLFIRSMLEYIFDSVGYTIDSSFITSDFFSRLIFPVLLPEKYGQDYSEDYLSISGELLNVDISTIIPTTPINFNQTRSPNIGANPYLLGEFTAPSDGFYLSQFRAEVSNIVGTVGFRMFLFDTTNPPFFSVYEIGDNNPTAYNSPTPLSGEIVLNLTAGQKIAVFVVSNTTVGSATADIFWNVDGEASISDGTLIDFRYLIDPSYTALDLIKGLSHLFNLVFQTNNISQSVTIEPSDTYGYLQNNPIVSEAREGFYNGRQERTRQVDLSKSGELQSSTDEGESILFTFKYEGETEEAVNLEQDLGFLQGQYVFSPNRFVKDTETSENPFFFATLQVLDDTVRDDNSNTSPQFPLIYNGNYLLDPTNTEAVDSFGPRILYKAPYIPTAEKPQIRIHNGGGGFNTIQCPLAYMIDYNDVTNGNYIPLSYGNYTDDKGNEIKGTVDRFYLAELKRKEIGKDLETWMFWNFLDIQNLNFRNKVVIKDDEYILQEIKSFNALSDKSSRTYLQYDAKLDAADEDKVESPIIDNKVS